MKNARSLGAVLFCKIKGGKNMQSKKGISLIVLVITIIVMIILAAAIIISLNNTGIIENSNKAVDETNEKTVQEIANLAWGEAYASGARSASDLKDAVETALENNNLNVGDYGINVTESGVDIAKGWLQTKNRTVVKGDRVLNIGDTVNYDETNGGKTTVQKDVNWKVLGAENGELLIMSTDDVDAKYFNSDYTLEGGQEAYTNGINELNTICKVYGKGKGATGARSITAEDVDRVTGYDKITYEGSLGTGKIKYGESITYYWDTTTDTQKKPYYETGRGLTGNLNSNHTKFVYHDGSTWQESVMPTTLPTERQKICTLTQTYYYYHADNITLTKTNTDGTANKAYNMLFGSSEEHKYWLASSFVDTNAKSAYFGLRIVNSGSVYGDASISSRGGGSVHDFGIRAVVLLSPSVSLTGTSDSGYEIL